MALESRPVNFSEMIAFNYQGAKNRHLPALLQILDTYHAHYVEPYAGSLSVMLNKQPSPLETASDCNEDIVNFFQVLRDEPARLIELLQLTPYSRTEFQRSFQRTEDRIENARRFFVRIMMDHAKGGREAGASFAISKQYRQDAYTYQPYIFYKKLPRLYQVANRLKSIQFESRPALEIIENLDSVNTLFYIDPPYLTLSRSKKNLYAFEMSDAEHIDLAEKLNRCTGKVAISGFPSALYDEELYRNWFRYEISNKIPSISRTKAHKVREIVWTNFSPSILI